MKLVNVTPNNEEITESVRPISSSSSLFFGKLVTGCHSLLQNLHGWHLNGYPV